MCSRNTCLTLMIVMSAAQGTTINVPGDQPTIQAGIDAAADGDTVLAAPSTYQEQIDFTGKAIVVTSVAPEDSVTVASTVIDATGLPTGSVVLYASGETTHAILQGLTITGGTGEVIRTGPFGGESTAGGGIFCANGAAPVIRLCVIRDNGLLGTGAWKFGGGGVFAGSGTAPIIESCSILANQSNKDGGGAFAAEESSLMFSGTSIRGNSAPEHGGGVGAVGPADLGIEDCVIRDNTAMTLRGGGVWLEWGAGTIIKTEITGNQADSGGGLDFRNANVTLSQLDIHHNDSKYGGGVTVNGGVGTIQKSRIARNTATREGGGLRLSGDWVLDLCRIELNTAPMGGGVFVSGATARFKTTVLRDNSATLSGGAARLEDTHAEFDNCLIADNEAPQGAALHCWEAAPWITNCTLTGNASQQLATVISERNSTPKFRNSILWNETPLPIYVEPGGSEAFADYCDVAGGWPGEGTIDADPRWRSFHGFPYIQGPASPCVDSGDPALRDTVYDAHPRWPAGFVDGPRSDMGAYGGRWNWRWVLMIR